MSFYMRHNPTSTMGAEQLVHSKRAWRVSMVVAAVAGGGAVVVLSSSIAAVVESNSTGASYDILVEHMGYPFAGVDCGS